MSALYYCFLRQYWSNQHKIKLDHKLQSAIVSSTIKYEICVHFFIFQIK